MGVGYQGEGFRLLFPQLTLDLHLTPRTGGATRIISRETSCQVEPGRGPRTRGCRVPPSSDPGALSSSQDPGVPAPSFPLPPFLPLESAPASEPQQLTTGHYICAFQVVSGSGRKECGGAKESVGGLQGKRQVGLACAGNQRLIGRVPCLVQPLQLLSPVHSLSSCGTRESERTTTPMGSGADMQWMGRLAALRPAGSCSSFPQ